MDNDLRHKVSAGNEAKNKFPIYTKESECSDCYKCVRNCPVKSIKIENGEASIIADTCIACGNCVITCPSKAKTIRNDVGAVKELLKTKKEVYVSLAPSFVGTFLYHTKEQLITAIKRLGFKGVSETALGAEAVSQALVEEIEKNKEQKLFISSACPATVDFIRYYLSEFTPYITKFASPALTHAKILKEEYGNDIGIVFIGPCIAKKNEFSQHEGMIDYALTFQELYNWFESEGIDLNKIPVDSNEKFVPVTSNEGALYPIESGMNKTLENNNISKDIILTQVSGILNIKHALMGLYPPTMKRTVFVETLACLGGCIHGPATLETPLLSSMSAVWDYAHIRDNERRKPKTVFNIDYTPKALKDNDITPEQIAKAMESIGKYSVSDELNCSGCGYNSCHDMVIALIKGNAETSMCVSYMRNNATKKANLMIKSMNAGVIIADNDLKIIEVNPGFHNMFSSTLSPALAAKENSMIGFNVERILPNCGDLFENSLKHRSEIVKERFPIDKQFYNIRIFPIDNLVCAIVENVTSNAIRHDEIRRKAKEVIVKNIATVQEIASLLGEHIVDTEIILSSIANDYDGSDEDENSKESNDSNRENGDEGK